ncbi:MAG TPA: hypothetical protein VED00_02195 [archaeon]|nr:hypothetical protein [archaeon]
MEQNMKGVRIWLLLVILAVVVMLSALWTVSIFWFPSYPWGPNLMHPAVIHGDLALFYTAQTVVSTVNVTLLVFLLFIYIGIYRETQSEFTVGLIIFSVVLLLNGIASNPLVRWAFGFRAFGLGPFILLPDLFTFAALIVLLYLSLK